MSNVIYNKYGEEPHVPDMTKEELEIELYHVTGFISGAIALAQTKNLDIFYTYYLILKEYGKQLK